MSILSSLPAVHLPPHALDTAPTTEVGGYCALEVLFGYQPEAPTPVVTPEQRAQINAEIAVHIPNVMSFMELAPSAFAQTKMRVESDSFQVRCLKSGTFVNFKIAYNGPKPAESHESGFHVLWSTFSFMAVDHDYSLPKKRVGDKLSSLIANMCAMGFAWN